MRRFTLKKLLARFRRQRAPASYAGGATAVARRRRLRRLLRGADASVNFLPEVAPARIALFTVTVLLLSALLSFHLLPNRISLKLGDVSDREIIAQRTVSFEDTVATQQLRTDVGQHVEKQYDPIQEANTTALDNLRSIFDTLNRIERGAVENATVTTTVAPASGASVRVVTASPKASSSMPSTASSRSEDLKNRIRRASAEIRNLDPKGLPDNVIATLLQAGSAGREQASEAATKLVERTMEHVIPDDSDELTMYQRALKSDPMLSDLAAPLREAVGTVAGSVLMPNQRFNARATENKRLNAEASQPAQTVLLRAGTVILRPGERVTQRNIDEFAKLGLQSEHLDAAKVAVISLLVLMIVATACVYLRQFHQEMYSSTSCLLLLATLTVLSVLGLRIGSSLLGIQIREVQLGYLGLMSVASAGMVTALLLSPRVALLLVALLSIASGLILNNDLGYTVVTMASSLVGIVSISTLRNRGDLLRACFILCSTTAVFTVLVGQLEGDLPTELLSGAVWGVISGAVALGLFVLGVAVFEKPFGITTHLRLLELSDPATSVLQEFRLRVPGTYAHSLMVGSLASAAAEAIGADGLLVRVAAYYHDLGKMNRPEFFIENQSNAENVHDRLNPSLSAIILNSHVKEGLEMTAALGLPPRVRELIQQHHGTSLMKYFYHRAAANGNGHGGNNSGNGHNSGVPDTSLEAQFRYPGPKPQTREAAILMLADSVEAASRVLDRPTPARISDFVQRMIDDKQCDGQLDESDLTLRDLKAIHDVFVHTLAGTLHARIEYPEDKRAASSETVTTQPLPDAATVEDALARLTVSPTHPLEEHSEHGNTIQTRQGVEAPDWEPARKAARNLLAQIGRTDAEVSVLLTDDAEIRRLNRNWRQIDRPTDVLSWPQENFAPPTDSTQPFEQQSGEDILGDVAISLDTARRQAEAREWSVADEVALLLVHGMLHLIGHEDDTESGAVAMRAIETRILGRPLEKLEKAEKTDMLRDTVK